jgi:hypothetical protein
MTFPGKNETQKCMPKDNTFRPILERGERMAKIGNMGILNGEICDFAGYARGRVRPEDFQRRKGTKRWQMLNALEGWKG